MAELETHLTLAVRLEFVEREKATVVWNMTQEVGKMLSSMLKNLKEKTINLFVRNNRACGFTKP